MLHNAFKKQALIAFSVLALAGCDKPVCPPEIVPLPPGPQLKKVVYRNMDTNNADSLLFDYAANGRLTTLTTNEFDVNGGPVIYHFEYNNDGHLNQISMNNGIKKKYVYLDGQLARVENFNDNRKISENVIEWNNKKIVSNTLFFASTTGDVTSFKAGFRGVYSYARPGIK